MSSRATVVLGTGLAVLFVSLAVSAPVLPKEPGKEASWIGASLRMPIDFPGVDDPKMTLGETMEALSRLSGVTIAYNHKAFRAANLADVERCEVASTRPIPPLKNKLGVVLGEILGQCETDPPLAYLIRGDRIEILPESELRRQIWGERALDDPDITFLPLVHLRATDRPLADLLADASEQSDVNVLLDPRCQEKARQTMAVRLVNTPADTAVETLADMAGLEVVLRRNVLYVTSAENAARIRKEQERKQGLATPGFPFQPFFGPGANPFGSGIGGANPR